MSKCEVCDNHGANIAYNEGMYHAECYYECYVYAEYDEGYQYARQEIDNNELNVDVAIMVFDIDPADTAFQYGYRRACLHEIEKERV